MRLALRIFASGFAVVLLSGLVQASASRFGHMGAQLKADPNGNGLLVVAVIEGEPADKAGLKADDRITKLDDSDVGDLVDFVQRIRDHKAGDEVKLTVLRGEETKEIKIKLD